MVSRHGSKTWQQTFTSYSGSVVCICVIVIHEGLVELAGDLQVDAEGQRGSARGRYSEASRRGHVEFLRTGGMLFSVSCRGVVT